MVWRELLDLWRDKRTLVSVVLLPIVGLPGLALLTGLLASAQSVTVLVVVEDPGASDIAGQLASMIADRVEAMGSRCLVKVAGEAVPGDYDLVVVVPEGFSANLSRLDGRAVLIVSRGLGQAADIAYRALLDSLGELSGRIVVSRIDRLASLAGVPVDPRGLLNPIVVRESFHAAGGAPATGAQARVAFTARILEFAMFFVVNPAIVYVSDSIIGERERRTLERLLATPLPRRTLLAGKMLAATVLGLASSLVDAAGVLAFFRLSGMSLDATLGLALAWASAAALVILATAALAALVSSMSPSVRSAQNTSLLIVMAALSVYFASLAVDLSRLPPHVSIPLQLLPFTHAALAVHLYALGDASGFLLHIAILGVYSLALLWAAARVFEAERIVLFR